MENEEFKIAKLLNEFLLNDDFIKNLSLSYISKFVKLNEFSFIRFFQSDSKLGIDFIDINNDIYKLNTYLFNEKGFLENSFILDIELTFENGSIYEYNKISLDFEKDSELEKIRNSALEKFELYNNQKITFIERFLSKNKKFFNFFKKIFSNNVLLLEQPNEEFLRLKELFTCIINKQLIFSKNLQG